ncbi:MAG: hypothetical protein AAFY56_04540 [Pseudomonadota bacterium]
MKKRYWKMLLLSSTALALPFVVAANYPTTIAEVPGAELLNPALVKASACGSPAVGNNELFKPGVRLAAMGSAVAAEFEDVPLFSGLGDLTFEITTSSEEARRYFEQGLALTYAFNHAAALESFHAAQFADPTCAMCCWGAAYALGPNINDPMHAENIAPAFAEIAQAIALKGGASLREQALIDALSARYSADPEADRLALDLAYAEAMAGVVEGYSGDQDIAVLYAEALMNTQPWDYWKAGGVVPKGAGGAIVSTLEQVLTDNPDHPHAIHLYIHAVEASADPARAERYADRLAPIMPSAGHLVHMPGHIYYRIGRYVDSMETNRKAVAADEAFFEQLDDDGIYRFGYYPHNLHFLLVSALMAGGATDAVDAAQKLGNVMSDDIAEQVPWVQAIKTAPYTTHAVFSDPETVLSIDDPGDRFPMVRAFWHYARAIAQVRAGNPEAAAEEVRALQKIRETSDFTSLVEGFVPAPELLVVAELVVDGQIARVEGRYDDAIEAFEAAAAIQDNIPYMEPPYWYYPVRQSLAAAQLEAGDAEAAADTFRRSLVDTPNNGWALWGLMQAQKAMGDKAGAKVTSELLEQAWAGPSDLLTLQRL